MKQIIDCKHKHLTLVRRTLNGRLMLKKDWYYLCLDCSRFHKNYVKYNQMQKRIKVRIRMQMKDKCESCGNTTKELLHTHHRDFNHDNNKQPNLQILCNECHNKQHSKKYNKNTGNKAKSRMLVNKLIIQKNPKKVVKNEAKTIISPSA